MAKISTYTDGGALQTGDAVVVARAGGTVKLTGLKGELDSKASATHNHDLSYDALGSASAALTSALAADFDGTWVSLTGKPTTFAPIIGGGAGDACAGNDPRLSDARAPLSHTQASTTISDSTTTGRAVLTAASAAAARTAIGAGTSSFDGTWVSLTGKPSTFPATQHSITGAEHSFPGGTTTFLRADGTFASPTASAAWGSITGTLSTQTDLQTALDAKAASSHVHAAADITSGTMATARLGSGTANSSTYLRGDQTWATPAGGGVFASARLTADRTTTSTALANVTDLAIAIGASETWSFEAYLSVGCNNTGGSQFAVTVPTGATLRVQFHGNTSSATGYTSGNATTSDGVSPTMLTVSAQNRRCHISGVVVNSTTAGSIQVRFKSVTSTQTTTVSTNSYITGRKH